MSTFPARNMQHHVPILGWLYLVSHALFLAIGLLVFVLLTGMGVATDEPEARSILTIVGVAVGLLLAVLSIPGLVAGYGLLSRKGWGPSAALVVAILNLVNIPVGTALGVYTLWVLTQPDIHAYFNARTLA